ncbi:4Fe-4S ferredoxin [Paracidovorax avenae]|uniref:4Fe-4S dicluster domain-containing protein n=1 Tax=Paracidovorax avenae TaxID=80867 RepID=UPI000D15C081|nr:4Fe-4S dicluster domain-containing protein [Paracidovorax avenae]AVS92936.1 4Fe-4S ferredoxin [Paracidovorax avenae]AVT04557.1 4Fe-4S ferredoxin [Paracidovorax avenae]AVT18573.1 4Fe-4S ferredoxin [Paracidovorax avenae]
MSPSVPKALPAIDPVRCTGCGRCVAVCAPHVLSLGTVGNPGRDGAPPPSWGPKRSILNDPAGCTGCALCAVHCPFDAIRMERARPR